MHGVLGHRERGRQLAQTPMGGTVAGASFSGRQNPGSQSWSQNRRILAGMISIESIESRFREALFPADDGRRTDLQPAFDGVERSSLGQHQDELGAKDIARWHSITARNSAPVGLLARVLSRGTS